MAESAQLQQPHTHLDEERCMVRARRDASYESTVLKGTEVDRDLSEARSTFVFMDRKLTHKKYLILTEDLLTLSWDT